MASKKKETKVYTARVLLEIEAKSPEEALTLAWDCVKSSSCVVLDVVRVTEK